MHAVDNPPADKRGRRTSAFLELTLGPDEVRLEEELERKALGPRAKDGRETVLKRGEDVRRRGRDMLVVV
jgi:hypothetical protein